MTHADEGHYAAKHPSGTELNPKIAQAVKKEIAHGKITCVAAHEIAHILNVPPADVGVTVDLLEVRISECQLGLYGYSPDKRILEPAKQILPSLEQAIKKAVVNDRISCFSCWEIAQQYDISRMHVAAGCEKLKIKISSCLLGAF